MAILIWFLPSVNYLMNNEVWLSSKGFTTVTTLIGLLLSVNYLMHSEAWLKAKGFSTLTTGLLPSVNSLNAG
jgi:hypothetical protein